MIFSSQIRSKTLKIKENTLVFQWLGYFCFLLVFPFSAPIFINVSSQNGPKTSQIAVLGAFLAHYGRPCSPPWPEFWITQPLWTLSGSLLEPIPAPNDLQDHFHKEFSPKITRVTPNYTNPSNPPNPLDPPDPPNPSSLQPSNHPSIQTSKFQRGGMRGAVK